jgi:hypothetical protein
MAYLEVSPGSLVGLASKLEEAALQLQSANDAVETRVGHYPHYRTLFYHHGPICEGTRRAAKDAELTRNSAGNGLAAAVRHLADGLGLAALEYSGTDERSGDILDRQVQI